MAKMSEVVILLMLALTGLAAPIPVVSQVDRFVVNVATNGNDTSECLQGGKMPCLTIDYVLRNLLQKQRSSVKIVVSNNQSLPSAEGYISWVPNVAIVAKKNVVFRCNDGVSPFLNFIYVSNSIVHMKRLNFENCRTVDDGIGFIIAYVEELYMEDCTFRNGGTVSLALVKEATVDNCVFERLNGTLTPVLVYQATSLITAISSKKPKVYVRNSQIINNKGLWDNSTSSRNVGNGMMIFALNGLQRNYSIHYEIVIEDCVISNNKMKGKILPILTVEKSSNVSVNFTILRSKFTNNSVPPTILLGSNEAVDVELNIIDSVFQNSSLPLDRHGVRVLQSMDSSGYSANTLHTKIKGTQFGDNLGTIN